MGRKYNSASLPDKLILKDCCYSIWPHDNLSPFGCGCRCDFCVTTSWTVPAGVCCVRVRAIGGGGAGSNQGCPSSAFLNVATGGGGGGYAYGVYSVVPGCSICVTVGAGGCVRYQCCLGMAGGASSFGSCLSATGGGGGCALGCSASGGAGSGGQVNTCGGRSGSGCNNNSQCCSATGGGAAGYFYGNGGNGGDLCCSDSFLASGGGGVYGNAVGQAWFCNLQCGGSCGGPDMYGAFNQLGCCICNSSEGSYNTYLPYVRAGAGSGGSTGAGYVAGGIMHGTVGGGGASSYPGFTRTAGNGGFPGGGGGGAAHASLCAGNGADGLVIVEW